jgi:hypothetical protein
MLDDRWWMEAVRDTPSHMYYSTETAGGLYADKAPSNVASISEVGKYLNITIPYDALHASFPRFHHQSRQVQQMAAPPTDERCIQHASGVDRDDAQEAGPLELLWVREDDGRNVGAELERILPGGLDGRECAAIQGVDLLDELR